LSYHAYFSIAVESTPDSNGLDPEDEYDWTLENDYGQTPLSWAARNGHEAVVKLLLTKDGVDMNQGYELTDATAVVNEERILRGSEVITCQRL
jgi:ankyrin repeat protein